MSEMYQEMVCRYLNMGTKQFLKDLRRQQDIQKTAAHRHNIMMRQKKKEKKDTKVALEVMRADCSPGRVTSHRKLMGIIAQFGDTILETYTKSELHSLCDAYGVPFTASTKKGDLCKLLAHSVNSNNRMPFPINLAARLKVVSVGDGERVKIRILSAVAQL